MKQEARLLQYSLLYNRSGKLITERISTDIKKLKPYFTNEEFATLQTIIREGTTKLDEIHNYVDANLNARRMTD